MQSGSCETGRGRVTQGDLLTPVKKLLVLFANVTTDPSKQYWGRFYSFKMFIAARFITTVLRIIRAYTKSVCPFICCGALFCHGMDMCLGKSTTDLWVSPPKLHGCLTRVHAAMETLALHCCLMVLKDFKETGLGCCNPYRAARSAMNLNTKCCFVRCLHFSLLFVEEYCLVVLSVFMRNKKTSSTPSVFSILMSVWH